MLSQQFENSEELYRRIPNRPSHWKSDRTPSSAAFKDSRGLSVDRGGARSEDEIIQSQISQGDLAAVVSVTVGFCLSLPTTPKYIPYPPAEDNIFHAEIHESEVVVEITNKKAKALARNAAIVWERPRE